MRIPSTRGLKKIDCGPRSGHTDDVARIDSRLFDCGAVQKRGESFVIEESPSNQDSVLRGKEDQIQSGSQKSPAVNVN